MIEGLLQLLHGAWRADFLQATRRRVGIDDAIPASLCRLVIASPWPGLNRCG